MTEKLEFDLNIDNPTTTRDMVYDKIYNAIVLGHFKPGERLLERDLAAKMGVSRTPVREALLQLEKANFVHALPYRGVAVTQLTYREAREIYQLRQLLEGASAALAAERCHQGLFTNEIDLLWQSVEEYKKCYTEDIADEEQPYDASIINLDFHMMIAELSGNAMLAKHIKNLQIYMGLLHDVTLASRSRYTLTEHSAIVSAIEKGQPEQASLAVQTHLHELWNFTKQSSTFKPQPHEDEYEEDIEASFHIKFLQIK